MCGIIGAVSKHDVTKYLIDGLKRLEYRGYDSCGLAINNNGLKRSRSVDRVSELECQITESKLKGNIGIAHTRWATHGAPITNNAHPHFSKNNGSNQIGIVHNGIIENYEELREELISFGFNFETQTDTEVVAHLINHHYQNNFKKAVLDAVKKLSGAFSILVINKDEENKLIGFRNGCPLVIGIGNDENFVASDSMALENITNEIIYLEEGDLVEITKSNIKITDQSGNFKKKKSQIVKSFSNKVDLGKFKHYMQKEIFEQPQAISDTLEGVLSFTPELFGKDAEKIFKDINSILILACGTSFYAGMTAKYWIEDLAKIPTSVEIASEYRYRNPSFNPKTLVIVISQSGETADTLAALKYSIKIGHKYTLSICNVSTSAIIRETTLNYLTRAGIEIGVASTKAFTTQLTTLFLLTLTLASLKNLITKNKENKFLKELRHLPLALKSVLKLEPEIILWAKMFSKKDNILFLGRGLHYPIAMEGALKLKEISYIHAEGYPAGELKHGPLALVTESMPVVTIAPNDELIEKLKSNINEVSARGGKLFIFADSDTFIKKSENLSVIKLPEHYGLLSPIIHTIPLQLLAYHTALARGTDVDKPRNLAKSVTVE
tara:strand:- start:649 stop:2475 length:1827 start_codon:yes stop_codon:yes gene_type:complete